MAEKIDISNQMQRVDELVQEIETWADPNLRSKAVELVQALMDFHGAGIDRMMDITANKGAAGFAIFDEFAKDDLVGNMLLLYGLHPLDIETRIKNALEKVRPSLNLHEGNVELLGVNEGIVNLRLQGNCDGCPSSALTLKHTIEEAIYAAAPDVVSIQVENLTEPAIQNQNGFVQIGKAKSHGYTDCEIAVI
ncbi:MAG: NifU family protein [Pyrinomonadaceae bacterium]